MKVRHPVRWNSSGAGSKSRGRLASLLGCRHRFGDDLGRDRSDHTAGFRGSGRRDTITVGPRL